MTDGSRFTGNDGGTGYERGSTGIPRWVKVAGIVAAIVVLVVVILAAVLSSDGDDGHTPRRHSFGNTQISPTAVETGVPLA
jgi:energy-converting hydrogenase Eha subunit A